MILDTNAISAFLDQDPNIQLAVTNASTLELPVVVLGEYRYGLIGSTARLRLEPLLNSLLEMLIVLDIDVETTAYYAQIRHSLRRLGRPIPANDVWFAALARQHSQPILSRDAHFDVVPGVERKSW